MTSVSLNTASRCVELVWAYDAPASVYPYIWLRDNCPSNFHPQTDERVVDVMHLPADLSALDAVLFEDSLRVTWSDDHVSVYALAWLRDHTPGKAAPDAADIASTHWRGSMRKHAVPSAPASELLSSSAALRAWMIETKRFGFGLVTAMQSEDAGMQVASAIGFQRQTNFGTTFEVVSKPNPNNLAYTSIALPLHTDLTNQETPPGFQFLHCIANEAEGGESVFCDGFAVADDLRRDDPDAFQLLAETYIPMRFHDDASDLRKHERVIIRDHRDRIVEIRFNAHLAGTFDMAPEKMEAYYQAYRRYMAATRSAAYTTSFKLAAGEMIVFDNRRILHGRTAFDPSTGFRHLRGCYVDRGEWDSRMRLLARRERQEAAA